LSGQALETRNPKQETSNCPIRPNPYGVRQATKPKGTKTMSKKAKTATAEKAAEPIVANGIEFTPKMIEDLTKIAEIEASTKKDKKTADSIKSMYKLFIEENEAALRGDWVRVGNLRVRLEVSRTLKIEIVD
jgi:hypothetical protein